MDVMLQHHNAKHACSTPDGLHELCADISREVIRSQPEDVYCFIADYLDALMITRENAKIALKLVQNVTLRSEHLVEILASSGLKLEEIAAAAPRLQKAFRVYLEAVDAEKKECGCDDSSEIDAESEISICEILKETGTTYHAAWDAATKIQALFRGHYERMRLAECRGEVQWQRAAMTTMGVLRKLGVTQSEATQAAIIIQSVYRGYYTRKNLRLQKNLCEEKDKVDTSTWFSTMFENTGLTLEQANKAATTIQTAFRRYRARKSDEIMRPVNGDETIAEMSSASKELKRRRSDVPSSDDDSLSDSRGVRFRSHVVVSVSGTLIPGGSDDDLEDEMSSTLLSNSLRSVERSQVGSLNENKVDDDVVVAENDGTHTINEEDNGVSDE